MIEREIERDRERQRQRERERQTEREREKGRERIRYEPNLEARMRGANGAIGKLQFSVVVVRERLVVGSK